VAVKYPLPELAGDARVAATFAAEARVAAGVRHPSLVRVLGAGADERGPYLVLPLLEGAGLRERLLAERRLPESEVRRVACELSGALAVLHAAGWVHGDLKPENVRFDADGRAVLLDLGFAHRPEAGDQGRRPGSLAYLAPEQVRGGRGGPASDVFALGVIAFELASGEHPFASGGASGAELGPSAADTLLERIARAPFDPPSLLVPELSPFLDHVVGAALELRPEHRPRSGDLARTLELGERSAFWNELVAAYASPAQAPPLWPRRHAIPWAGRDGELAEIAREHAAVTQGGGRVIWLQGPVGSGKSRLVEEAVARLRLCGDPPLFLQAEGSEWMVERPGQPVRNLIRQWLHLASDAAPGDAERARLEGLVSPGVAAGLFQSLDPAFEGTTEVALAHGLFRWWTALAERRPLVVFLDDVPWTGEVTLEVVSRVVEHLARTRLLLILGARDGMLAHDDQGLEALRARLAASPRATELRLAPLEPGAVRVIVDRLFDPSTPARALAERLWECSGGAPDVIDEIVRSLRARGRAVEVDGGPDGARLRLLVPPSRLRKPASLMQALAQSLRSLPAFERAWLSRLAVVGGRIEPEFLARAFPSAEPAVIADVLTLLVDHGWLERAGARYRFRHPAQRQAVYASIPAGRRKELHRAAARALAPEPALVRSLGAAYQRAYHLHEAGAWRELLADLPRLLARMLASGHARRIHVLASWGLEALDADLRPEEGERLRIELLERAADAADRLGWRAEERRLLARLSDSALDAEDDPLFAGRLYLLHGRSAAGTGQFGIARGFLHNARTLLGRAGDRDLESQALRRLADIQLEVGALDEAHQLARAARRRALSGPVAAFAHLSLALVDLLGDRFESTLRQCDRARELARGGSGEERGAARAAAQLLRARTLRLVGRPRRALGAAHRAMRMAEESGERRLVAEATARRGQMFLDADRPGEAHADLREALYLAREMEDKRTETLASVFLGTLLAEEGEREAGSLLVRATELAREIGMPRAEALGLAVRGRLARELGDPERGLEHTLRARELWDRVGGELADRVVILASHSLLLRAVGRTGEAHELARALGRTVQRVNRRIVSPILRQRHRRASVRLLEAALSPEGPLYPRVQLRDLALEG